MIRLRISTPVAFLLLLILCSPAVAATRVSRITNVSIGPDKQVHILHGNEESFIAPKEADQVDCSSPKTADDNRTAGWLVDFDNCCTSYPIPLTLVIYRDGKIIQRFRPGQSIWDWRFLKAGKQIVFWIGPTHGTYTPHFELHDVKSGRLLSQWDGHMKDKHPAWISRVESRLRTIEKLRTNHF